MPPADADATNILELVGPLSAFTVGMTDIIDDSFGTQDAGDAEDQAILALIRAPSISISDLGVQSGLSRRARSRLVRQLLGDGLVRQAPAPDDRRVQLLTLTRRGRQRASELEQRLTDYFAKSSDLVADILSLLADDADTVSRWSSEPMAALDVLDHLSSFGRTLDAAIRAHHAPKHPKNRDQLALLLIAIGSPARPSRLADELTLTPGGMTRVLNKLEADRLIVRSHGQVQGDRRAVVIDLTSDGHDVIAAIAAGLTSMSNELRSLFTAVAMFAPKTATAS